MNIAKAPATLAAEAQVNYQRLQKEIAPLKTQQDRQDALDELARKYEVGGRYGDKNVCYIVLSGIVVE